MNSRTTLVIVAALSLACPTIAQEAESDRAVPAESNSVAPKQAAFAAPVRLEADGEPIDIGSLSKIAHAGPWIADIDGDGDRDLLVGDFPGYFWVFDNTGTDKSPIYKAKGKLQAGGEDAKTPVY